MTHAVWLTLPTEVPCALPAPGPHRRGRICPFSASPARREPCDTCAQLCSGRMSLFPLPWSTVTPVLVCVVTVHSATRSARIATRTAGTSSPTRASQLGPKSKPRLSCYSRIYHSLRNLTPMRLPFGWFFKTPVQIETGLEATSSIWENGKYFYL